MLINSMFSCCIMYWTCVELNVVKRMYLAWLMLIKWYQFYNVDLSGAGQSRAQVVVPAISETTKRSFHQSSPVHDQHDSTRPSSATARYVACIPVYNVAQKHCTIELILDLSSFFIALQNTHQTRALWQNKWTFCQLSDIIWKVNAFIFATDNA